MAVWIWDDPPEYIAKWKRGADGERRTEKALKALNLDRWHAVHDRQAAHGNLDHIVVGPAGVFLLDSKNLSGKVTLEGKGLTTEFASAPRDRFTRTALGGSVRHAAANLKRRLEEEAKVVVWVQAVVVIWGEFEQQPTNQENVVYLHGNELTSWLSGRPNRLSPRNQSLIELALKAELVAPPFVQAALAIN